MMTRQRELIKNLGVAEEQQVLRMLQKDGVELDDYVEIGKDTNLRKEVIRAILQYRMFTSPEAQTTLLLSINCELWKDPTITSQAIVKLGPPPKISTSDAGSLCAVVLLSETGNVSETFERNWLACQLVQGESSTWRPVDQFKSGVRLRDGARPRRAGLRWAVVDLGQTYAGCNVHEVQHNLDIQERFGVGQELPLIAALHSRWARALREGCEWAPYICAPDLVTREGNLNPYLRFQSQRNELEMVFHEGARHSVSYGYMK